MTQYDDKECSKYPQLPSILPAKKRIIVIGDIHGDYQLTINIFKMIKLIDDNFKWIAEPQDTVVVQVGDQIDRCRVNCSDPLSTIDDENSDIKILIFFTKIHIAAAKYGGGVYSLLGNHEMMNVQGNFDYVSYKGLHENGGRKERYQKFKQGGPISRFMACTRQTAIIIGEFLFVHAGLVPELIKKYKITNSNIYQLNAVIRKWLLDKIKGDHVKQQLINGVYSPFWPRVYGMMSSNIETCDKDTENVFETLHIKGMIIGHTPQYGIGINSTCQQKIWRVDNGMSKAFGDSNSTNNIQVLEILDNQLFNIIKMEQY